LIFFFDVNEEVLEDSTPLKELYDRVRGVMPTQKDLEPLLEMDRDEKKVISSFLSSSPINKIANECQTPCSRVHKLCWWLLVAFLHP
jgi:hypothetical protein